MNKKIIGVTVGTPTPRANLKQTDPRKADYVKGKDIIPEKVSQLENDAGYLTKHQDISGKLDASKLPEAIDSALARAKASGAFDGSHGGYYTPTVTQPDANTMRVTFAPSKTDMPSVSAKDIALPAGLPGEDGEDGVSPTLSVSKSGKVTTITIKDANGTKTAQINDGNDGDPGQNGEDGVGISTIKQTTTSAEDGGSNVFTVTLTNGQTATFTVKNGSKGSQGNPGKDGSPGAAGKDGEDGYTPARGTDYWTDDDIAEIKSYVDEAILGGAW